MACGAWDPLETLPLLVGSAGVSLLFAAVKLPPPSELLQALSENASAASKVRDVFLIFILLI